MSIDTNSLSFAQRLVFIKAGQLGRKFRQLAREGIEQELLTEVILRWPRFDAARGNAEAFIEEIVRSKICKIIRAHKRERKRLQRIARMLRPSFDPADQHDDIRDRSLQLDVGLAVSQLPPQMRDACNRLQRDTQLATAKAVGMSRNGLAAALIRSRTLFRDFDLDSYL